jgi:hypothetical protein
MNGSKSQKWVITHDRHGHLDASLIAVATGELDPQTYRVVNCVAIFNTRTAARNVIDIMRKNDMPIDGYYPAKCSINIQVVK